MSSRLFGISRLVFSTFSPFGTESALAGLEPIQPSPQVERGPGELTFFPSLFLKHFGATKKVLDLKLGLKWSRQPATAVGLREHSSGQSYQAGIRIGL